jgi:hypothetical protein
MERSSKKWKEVLFQDMESHQEEEWPAVLDDTDESEGRPAIRIKVIDSRANVNYANRGWCQRANIKTTNTGLGEIRAYDSH